MSDAQAGRGMEFPDSAGWWVHDDNGRDRFVAHFPRFELLEDKVRYRWGSNGSFTSVCSRSKFKTTYPGAWTRLHMPWEAAPPPVASVMSAASVAVIREALEFAKRRNAENMHWHVAFGRGDATAAEIDAIDTALAEFEQSHRAASGGVSVPSDVLQVAIECVESERSATENMMDTWKETSDTYKKYAAEVARYDTALAWLKRAQGKG